MLPIKSSLSEKSNSVCIRQSSISQCADFHSRIRLSRFCELNNTQLIVCLLQDSH